MKFTVNKKELQAVVGKVASIVSTKTTIPALSCIYFELNEMNQLTSVGNNLNSVLKMTIPVEGLVPGKIITPVKLLFTLLKQLPDVPITLDARKGKLHIKTNAGLYKLPLFDVDDFPKYIGDGEEKEIANFIINGKELSHIFESVLFAVSTDELRPILTGVHFEIDNNTIKATGTDGHRLSEYSISTELDHSVNIVLPEEFCRFFIRDFKQEDINITINEDSIVVIHDSIQFYSRLLYGMFPDTQRVIPKNNSMRVFVDKQELDSILKRISVFATDKSHQIIFNFDGTELFISATNTIIETEAKERLVVKNDRTLEIGLNASYLSEILSVCKNDELEFLFEDSSSAIIIKDFPYKEGHSGLFLLMPIRIQEVIQED